MLKASRLAVARVVAGLLMALGCAWILQASQNTLQMPTGGVVSGLQFSNFVTNALDALVTCNSGTSAPTNAAGGSPKLGQCWIDTTSATAPIKKRFDGTVWQIEGVLDVTNGVWTPPIAGGTGTVASASTANLWSIPQGYVSVTGTTTITSLASGAVPGTAKVVRFTGALTLTHNGTSLILPAGGSNITTAAGDAMVVVALTASNVAVTHYQRAAGAGVQSLSAQFDSQFSSTQGAILYRDASAWVALAPGTAGQALTTGGAAANVSWTSISGTRVLLQQQTASASATIDFVHGTGGAVLDNTYDGYEVIITGLRSSTDDVQFRFRVSLDSGSSFESGASDYEYANFRIVAGATAAEGDAAVDFVALSGAAAGSGSVGNASSDRFEARMFFADPEGDKVHAFMWDASFISATAVTNRITGTGIYGPTLGSDPINAIRFYMSSGNIASGRFQLYGIKK